MRRILFTLTLAAISAMMAIAQVTFKIEAPRQTEVGQQIRVKYVANTTDVEDIHVGDFPGFEMVYGPSTSRSNSFTMVNGKTSRSSTMTFTYVLVATKEGTHKLPAGTIKVDGKSIKSNTASIEVLPASAQGNGSNQGNSQNAQPQQGSRRGSASSSNGTNIGAKDLYMTVTANKTKVYEQEAVLPLPRLNHPLGIVIVEAGTPSVVVHNDHGRRPVVNDVETEVSLPRVIFHIVEVALRIPLVGSHTALRHCIHAGNRGNGSV